MGILQTPLGITLHKIPLKYSPFVISDDIGNGSSPPVEDVLLETNETPFLLTDGTYLLLAQ